MVRAGVLYLIAEDPGSHGAFEPFTPEWRRVFCTVRSVGMNEVYTAKSLGLSPEYVFELSDYAEYKGEKLCVYEDIEYKIVRTYVNGQKIELTVERGTQRFG